MKYINIQNDIINELRIDICDGTKCENDWRRTHSHVKTRRICKWNQQNSITSTFTLLHEIGHIKTTKSKMRRCESEFHATKWAINKAEEYNLKVGDKIIERYQNYINMEHDRGVRRGGKLPSIETFVLVK